MRGARTTAEQDMQLTNAEADQTIMDLLDIVKDLDGRLDKAIKRLEEHEINTDDL